MNIALQMHWFDSELPKRHWDLASRDYTFNAVVMRVVMYQAQQLYSRGLSREDDCHIFDASNYFTLVILSLILPGRHYPLLRQSKKTRPRFGISLEKAAPYCIL
jgi:hypothetical protein